MARDILVPLDGSTFSENALPVALDIARRTGARLHLVQVHEAPTLSGYPDSLPTYDEKWDGALRAREEEYLRSVAGRCMENAGISPVVELLEGAVVPALAAYAAEVGVDRIVMTTHGRGGISRAWMGSVADALVRRASVPLLLIRPKSLDLDWQRGWSPSHVLVPLDGSALSEGILDAALEFGALSGARFTLLRVVLPLPFISTPYAVAPAWDEEGAAQSLAAAAHYLDTVADRLRRTGAAVEVRTVFHTSPAVAILDYAATNAVDAIAMATHGRGGWSRVALGSVADKIVRGTMMPVLVYRPPARPLTDGAATATAAAGATVEDSQCSPV